MKSDWRFERYISGCGRKGLKAPRRLRAYSAQPLVLPQSDVRCPLNKSSVRALMLQSRVWFLFSHVRFGSKADMCSATRHVHFAPESGHVRRN